MAKSPPPADADLIGAGRALHAALDAFDDAVSEHLGVHRSDLRALNQLEHGPVSPGELRERLGLSSGAITAVIDRLVAAGFVDRAPSERDRRSVVVQLRPDAFARIGPLYRRLAQAVRSHFDDLDDAGRRAGADALQRFARACAEAMPPPRRG